ncbi:MAG TPA: polysaccharide deacetylase family protein [Vicinamibacterales bacterium]
MLKAAAAVLVAAVALVAAAGAQVPRRMALTFDDLPGVVRPSTLAALEDVNARLLATLRITRIPAIGFVNERALDVEGEREARIDLLRSWLAAGMTLGNHTYAHRGINDTPLPEYQDGVLKGERVTRPLLASQGRTLVWFRHPFTHTGPTPEIRDALDRFLEAHGYRVAPFTVENADYVFAAVYDRRLNAGDEEGADRVMAAYLDYNDGVVAWAETLAEDTFGRPIPQVLLAHVNRLNADAMPEMLRRLRARGYTFVSLEDATADAAYATRDAYVGRSGPSWLHRWRVALGKPSRLAEDPDPPDWVLEQYNSAN